MQNLFNSVYKDKTVLVTGHTGFKGSWLCLWLDKMGAKAVGYSLSTPTQPSHFDLLDLKMVSVIGDIRDREKLNQAFEKYKPDVVFHLAAQSLVRYSYEAPIETYETNVIGTLNIFEACRNNKSVKAIINVTSDKCYENKEWLWGYRENDPMGGHDPYSSSKGCSELLAASYRNSYFPPGEFGKKHTCLLASARAGNVIGGGDWAQDRLIPDIIRAYSLGETVSIRNPRATRPWQHVLEPLSGYLLVGQKLLEGRVDCATSWNFGPDIASIQTVEEVLFKIKKNWSDFKFEINVDPSQPHEANLLKLDSSKALHALSWKPRWSFEKCIQRTTAWYGKYLVSKELSSIDDLEDFIESF